MNDEGLLENGVSATKRGETIAGQSCFSNDGGEKNDGVEGDKKNVERWCFSIGKTDEGLLTNGVSTTKRGETIAGRSCFGNDGGEKNDGVEGDEKC
jgi:hypothetical protein